MIKREENHQRDTVRVGLIYKTHGIRGEVLILPLTSDSRRFERLEKIHLENKDGVPFKLTRTDGSVGAADGLFAVDYVKYHREKILLKFCDIDSADDALLLKGQYLTVAPEQLIPLAPDTYFIFDLVGCLVYRQADGELVGELTDVLETGSNDIYVVRDAKTLKEVLIPALKSVVREVRTDEKRIIVDWNEEST